MNDILWAALTYDGVVFTSAKMIGLIELRVEVDGSLVDFALDPGRSVEGGMRRHLVRVKNTSYGPVWRDHAGKVVKLTTDRGQVEIDIPTTGVVANLEYVADFSLQGWLAILFGEPSELTKLSVRVGTQTLAIQPLVRADLLEIYPPDCLLSFRSPLPSWCFDGLEHTMSVVRGSERLSHFAFRSNFRYNVELNSRNKLVMWLTDLGQHDEPFTIAVAGAKTPPRFQKSTERGDVNTFIGRRYAGIEVVFDTPPHEDVSVFLGAGMRVKIANLSAPEAVSIARAINGQLLQKAGASGKSLELRLTIANALRNRSVEENGAFELDFKNDNRPVAIVVPVYLGLEETQHCLSAIETHYLASGKIGQVVVIDDMSPDPEIRAICTSFKQRNSNAVHLIRNESNLGFVKSANRGMSAAASDHDLLLLNSDAVITEHTVHKLRYIAYREKNIATVTPLTNNGTIFSYPEVNGTNPMSIEEASNIDSVAQDAMRGQFVEVPVAVGFCTYIRREALREVGLFAEEWGRGYCEEVDWCRRASDIGFIHVAALDTFVWHEGSASFGSAEREHILKTNHAILDSKYPEYNREIEDFLKSDPLESARVEIFYRSILKNRDATIHFYKNVGPTSERDRMIKDRRLNNSNAIDLYVHREYISSMSAEVNVVTEIVSGHCLYLNNQSLELLFGRLKSFGH